MGTQRGKENDLTSGTDFERAERLVALISFMQANGEGAFIELALSKCGISPLAKQNMTPNEQAQKSNIQTPNSNDIYLKKINKLLGVSDASNDDPKSIMDNKQVNSTHFRKSVMRSPISRKVLQSMILLNHGVVSYEQLEAKINDIGRTISAPKIKSNTLRGRISLAMKDGFISPIPGLKGSYTMTVAQAKEAIERNEDFADIDLDKLFPVDERGEAVEPQK